MNFKILQIVKHETNTKQSSKKAKLIDPKYNKILNNLLSINSHSDNAIFSKLNFLNQDLTKILKPDDLAKIYTKFDFKIKIKKTSMESIEKIIMGAVNSNSLLQILEEIDYKPNNTELKQIKKELEVSKKLIVKNIAEKNNIFLTKWKKYKKTINDSFHQTNIWPLFVGTYFVKGKILDKPIYAPFLLKEVDISIEGNEVFLIAKNKSIILNEKITFFLEKGLNIETPIIDVGIDKITFEELSLELDYFFKNIVAMDHINIEGKFQDLTVQSIKKPELTKVDGMILVYAHPSGSSLRKATLDLIESGEINNLLHIENELTNFNQKSIENLVENDWPIARVCPTDASQEKAILSSLQEHAIIIGPPGTGKSQTIANLLTNILHQNKTALFISQKRVALEIVIERMGGLKYFMLQLIENQNTLGKDEKSNFYARLQKFIDYAKDETTNNFLSPSLEPLISPETKEYWKIKDSNTSITQEEIDLICEIKSRIPNSEENKIIQKIKKVLKSISSFKQINQYDNIEKILALQEKDMKELAIKLNVEPKKVMGLNIYHKSFKHLHLLNLELLDFLYETKTDESIIPFLKRVTSTTNLEYILKTYPKFVEPLTSTNAFNSNEEMILNSLKMITKLKIEKIKNTKKIEDKKWLSDFLGRIERGYTIPNNFITLFKQELKQMFNIVVSTPESLSSFIDFKKDKFDYIIFDEASQIFLEKALPFIALGKKIIVAGDDQQMQPSNWFAQRASQEDEDEVENIDSLLTYAIANSVPKYNLEFNYRSSSAALTTFSAKQFYNSDLKTLDKNGIELLNPIEVINVGGELIDGTNLQEANRMIEELKKNIKKFKKIILLTFNKHQLDLVNELLANTEPKIYDKIIEGEIILKNLENIQGDEADLVIVSIGYTKESNLASTYVGRTGGKNALNVAITRAKSKLIILKSLSSKDVKISNTDNIDLTIFKNWIQFLELSEEKQKEYAIQETKKTASIKYGFENDVYNWMLKQEFNRELELAIHYPIGSYRIDLALIDKVTGKFLLGIEVDGLKQDLSALQKYNDVVRHDFIESKNYKLIRISEILWKTNKNKVLEMIKEKISS